MQVVEEGNAGQRRGQQRQPRIGRPVRVHQVDVIVAQQGDELTYSGDVGHVVVEEDTCIAQARFRVFHKGMDEADGGLRVPAAHFALLPA